MGAQSPLQEPPLLLPEALTNRKQELKVETQWNCTIKFKNKKKNVKSGAEIDTPIWNAVVVSRDLHNAFS